LNLLYQFVILFFQLSILLYELVDCTEQIQAAPARRTAWWRGLIPRLSEQQRAPEQGYD
jgi:hypothetical protein